MDRNVLITIVVIALIALGLWFIWPKGEPVTETENTPNVINTTINSTTTINNSTTTTSGSTQAQSAVAAAVRARAATTLGLSVNEVTVLSTVVRDWTDSCLGLGGAAESCLQVITPGYQVTVRANGQTTVYRTNATASVIREQK